MAGGGLRHDFPVLVADYDEYNVGLDVMVSNHNDRGGTMPPQVKENEGLSGTSFGALSLSRYVINGTPRDLLDLNFAYQDGSVNRLDALKPDDDTRTIKVPQTIRASKYPAWYSRLPIQ